MRYINLRLTYLLTRINFRLMTGHRLMHSCDWMKTFSFAPYVHLFHFYTSINKFHIHDYGPQFSVAVEY